MSRNNTLDGVYQTLKSKYTWDHISLYNYTDEQALQNSRIQESLQRSGVEAILLKVNSDEPDELEILGNISELCNVYNLDPLGVIKNYMKAMG